jgi:hypothetical protein
LKCLVTAKTNLPIEQFFVIFEKYLVSSYEYGFDVWNIDDLTHVGGEQYTKIFAVMPDGYLVGANAHKSFCFIHPVTFDIKSTVQTEYSVTGCAVFPTGHLAVCMEGIEVSIFDPENQAILTTLKTIGVAPVSILSALSDGRLIYFKGKFMHVCELEMIRAIQNDQKQTIQCLNSVTGFSKSLCGMVADYCGFFKTTLSLDLSKTASISTREELRRHSPR